MTNDKFDLQKFLTELELLVGSIPEGYAGNGFRRSVVRKFQARLDTVVASLEKLHEQIDDIRQPKDIFDPSDPHQMGELLARTLLTSEMRPLATLERFYGSGVYALYYKGEDPLYAPISNTQIPIYVGKVNPKNATAQTSMDQGDKLWHRLVKDHAKSIRLAETTLNIHDFYCRYLVVKSAWQGTAEEYLIRWFRPIWNNEMKICYGIGKHGDKAETRGNTRSPWDELHPGRKWALNSTPYPGGEPVIRLAIQEHFEKEIPRVFENIKKLHLPVEI